MASGITSPIGSICSWDYPTSTGRISCTSQSSLRLSFSTFTRGSPITPSQRPAVLWPTSSRRLLFGDPPRLGDARNLEERRRGRDVRVEPACGCGDEIDRHRGRVGFSAFNLFASWVTRSIRLFEVGPAFDPPELLAL